MNYTANDVKTDLLASLDHSRDAFLRIEPLTGPTQPLTSPDLHKVAEGLFLSSWSRWELALRLLFIHDLGTRAQSVLRKDVKKFRYKHSDQRLAEQIADHPDTSRWVEWSSFDTVKDRADLLLGAGHRFTNLSGTTEIAGVRRLKKVRNAVAHKSDTAWTSFKAAVQLAPYNLTVTQLRFLTVGKFLAAHSTGGQRNVLDAVATLRSSICLLVP